MLLSARLAAAWHPQSSHCSRAMMEPSGLNTSSVPFSGRPCSSNRHRKDCCCESCTCKAMRPDQCWLVAVASGVSWRSGKSAASQQKPRSSSGSARSCAVGSWASWLGVQALEEFPAACRCCCLPSGLDARRAVHGLVGFASTELRPDGAAAILHLDAWHRLCSSSCSG